MCASLFNLANYVIILHYATVQSFHIVYRLLQPINSSYLLMGHYADKNGINTKYSLNFGFVLQPSIFGNQEERMLASVTGGSKPTVINFTVTSIQGPISDR